MSKENAVVTDLYRNPTLIQYKLMQGLASGGEHIVTSPNNVASHIIESTAVNTADNMTAIALALRSLSAINIETMDDLRKHMSAHDSIGMYSSPAITYINVKLSVASIVATAAPIVDGEPGLKVVIPAGSLYVIAGMDFTTYYDINILIDSTSATNITVNYSDTNPNPLMPLATIKLASQTIGTDIDERELQFQLPVYQLSIQSTVKPIIDETSFNRTCKFSDKFYAIRVFTNKAITGAPISSVSVDTSGISWTELDQSVDSLTYDANAVVPVVVVEPDILRSEIGISIPQIYMTRKMLGNNLRIEIYTTLGAIDIVMDEELLVSIAVTFNLQSDPSKSKYSKLLYHPDSFVAYPMHPHLVGGTDGRSFNEMRDIVIHNSNNNMVKVSQIELQHLFAKDGFRLEQFTNGILNRIYHALAPITSVTGQHIASGSIATVINTAQLTDTIGIELFNSGNLTITPLAMFGYDKLANSVEPLSTAMVNEYKIKLGARDVGFLNGISYTETPYFTSIQTTNDTALATTFDLSTPVITDILHIASDDGVAQLYILDVIVLSDIMTKTFTLRVFLSSSSIDLSIAEVTLQATFTGIDGRILLVGIPAATPAVDPITEMPYIDIPLGTTYEFDRSGNLMMTHTIDSTVADIIMALETKVTIEMEHTISPSVAGSRVEYELDMRLGSILPGIHNEVQLAVTNKARPIHTESLPLLHTTDVPLRDNTNALIYNVVDGKVVCLYEHRIGDPFISELLSSEYINLDNIDRYLGSVKPKLVAGNLIYDEDAIPLTMDNYADAPWEITEDLLEHTVYRQRYEYFAGDFDMSINLEDQLRVKHMIVSIIQVNVNQAYIATPSSTSKLSDRHAAYIKDIRDSIRASCASIESHTHQLLHGTNVFFKPRRNMGYVACKTDTAYSSLYDSELSIALRLHVPRHILINTAECTRIRNLVIEIIDNAMRNKTLALVAIGTEIKNVLLNEVHDVDILGINGDIGVQTIETVDPESALSLKYVLRDIGGMLVADRALQLTFVSK